MYMACKHVHSSQSPDVDYKWVGCVSMTLDVLTLMVQANSRNVTCIIGIESVIWIFLPLLDMAVCR